MKKLSDKILIILFVLFIGGFGIAFFILPDNDFSEEENRYLQTFPDFGIEELINGDFTENMNNYYADQFPWRNGLVGIKGVCETIALKGENNGVLLGRGGQLAVRLFDAYKDRHTVVEDTDYFFSENILKAADAVKKFEQNSEIPFTVMIPPRTVDVAKSAFLYPDELSERLQALLDENLSDSASYLNISGLLTDLYDSGEYVYYRTDHHWTTKGAYVAYSEIMKKWGMEDLVIDESEFKKEVVTDFYGTTWSRAGYKFISPDSLEIWTLPDDDLYVTTVYDRKNTVDDEGNTVTEKVPVKSFTSFYNREYLQKKDKYSVFLDGTHAEMTVTYEGNREGEREKILIAKDSFANPVVTFLARHFDIVVVNLASGMCDLTAYAQEYDCDRILVLYNLENLVENENLANIK